MKTLLKKISNLSANLVKFCLQIQGVLNSKSK